MDSNRGPLELEATALPTEPQPLPILDDTNSCSTYLLRQWTMQRKKFNLIRAKVMAKEGLEP